MHQYSLRRVMIEQYPCNRHTLGDGTADHVKGIRFEDVSTFYSQMSYSAGDHIVTLNKKEWTITGKVLMADPKENYIILYVEPYDGKRTVRTFHGTIEYWLPLIHPKDGGSE